MLIDTHAHLWWESYAADLPAVISRAKEVGVEKIIVPGTNIPSSQQAISLAKQYPNRLYPAVGIHPEDVGDGNIAELRQLLAENKGLVVAVGEIGIDLYAEKEKLTLTAQKLLFKEQCELALAFDLPVIIH